jgi:hypothetical protein
MSAISDRIGSLGESYFQVAMLNHKLFRPAFLGEKWPVSDYFVEIEDSEERYFFIVQVKASSTKFTKGRGVSIIVNHEKLRELASYGAPTYMAIVDVNNGKVFLKAAMHVEGFSPRQPIEMNLETSLLLKEDVIDFWKSSGMSDFKEKYQTRFQ